MIIIDIITTHIYVNNDHHNSNNKRYKFQLFFAI